MIFTPDHILEFGKNKGYKLGLIFKYNPSYIEWLVKNVETFAIDKGIITDNPEDSASIVSQVKSLLISMPGRQHDGGLRNNWNSTVKEAIDLESKGVVIPPIKYVFPDDIIIINRSKQSKMNQTV